MFSEHLNRLHEELRRSIEAQMDIVRQGEGSGVEKEVMGNMQHQLQLLSQVICYGSTSYYITELNYCVFKRTSQNA